MFGWYKYRIRLLLRDIISFIVFILLRIKANIFRKGQNGIRILVYHSIKEVPKNKDTLRITVSPELFEKQIRYLVSSGYEIISMDNLLDYISDNRSIIGKKIVLTFDDGFDDNFDYAYNLLKKNGLTATYFLVCDYIGSDKVFPWYDRNTLYSRPISWEKVLKLISGGMTIGSHALTHVSLGSINQGVDKVSDEIANSKKVLEDKLKVPVCYFAYPFGGRGSYNRATEEIIKKSGYKAACTNVLGTNRNKSELFELRRTRITWNDTLLKFRMKLEGAYDWIDRLPTHK